MPPAAWRRKTTGSAEESPAEPPDITTTASVATQVSAFALPANSRDAAVVLTLPPGAYTVQGSGAANGTGVALLEGALMHLECRTTDIHPGGDHAIVVAPVLSIDLPDTVGPALVHFRGRYGSIA